jgi:hypothetical protein
MLEHPDLDDDLEPEGFALFALLKSRGYNGGRLAACSRTCRLLAALAREGFKIRSSGRAFQRTAGLLLLNGKKDQASATM